MIEQPVPEVRHLHAARLTAGFERFQRLDLDAHLSVHGPMPAYVADELIDLAERINLCGRGGAAFPFGRKMRAVIDTARRTAAGKAVIVNATEGEPASWKDKVLLTRAPHLVLDGAALCAQALRAQTIVIAVADDGIGMVPVLDALAEREMPAPTRVVAMPHRFISGEAGALVRGINGEVAIPPARRILASDSGVDGLPTLLSNAETFAQLAVAARLGSEVFGAVGTGQEPGTVMLSVGGSAHRPAVVEVPTGVPLMDVLRCCEADIGSGVLVGGFHGKWMTPQAASTAVVSRQGLAAAGATLGAGVILPLGDQTCPLGESARVVAYLAGQSSGQCGPCRLGLPELARTFAVLADGGAGGWSLDDCRAAAGAVVGRGACAHPDGVSRFALSALQTFADDVAAHLSEGGCARLVRNVLPIPQPDSGSRLAVDWARCQGHGLCAHVLPELVQLDGFGYPRFPQAPIPAWLQSRARKAVQVCPALALRLGNAQSPAGGVIAGQTRRSRRAARR